MAIGLRLAQRVREVFINGTWIANTNYQKILTEITLEQATTKIYDLNPIWLLTCHINYYVAGVLQVLKCGTLEIQDKFSYVFKPPKTEQEWRIMVNELLQNAETFAEYVANMSDRQLQDTFVKEEYGNYQRNINGMIEHAYYHLGQISLIKKIIE